MFPLDSLHINIVRWVLINIICKQSYKICLSLKWAYIMNKSVKIKPMVNQRAQVHNGVKRDVGNNEWSVGYSSVLWKT